ncbi:KPN_02809 family neutral zinc metallopeptidase [Longitalea arenae]|uniref:KPN_02809 family neutral zinc metallopeptidase n=1 Tax=Longitalea arenae TaxID=2812558 RepID=UPI0019678792|nr:neutral zinc metallopeptidase [Longitalea arenae]
MKWIGRRESSNVEDRRGFSGGGLAVGGGIIGVIVLLVKLFLGGDAAEIPQALPQQGPAQEMSAEEQKLDDERASFIKVVLADTEDVWNKLFSASGESYVEPTLVLFRQSVQSACGMAGSATGPFYCPGDQKVYIDLSFFEDMQNHLHAPGDFAMAYVVAHEVGHHIQKLNGTSDKMHRLRQQLSEEEYNKYSVKLELQADFLAGVWAHHAQRMKNILEENDIEEALNAANAIGDDRLQKQAQGRVVPESFTHGTSAQRMYWFKKGFETGDLSQGNTFRDPSLN